MSTLYGKRDRFGIEWQLSEEYGGAWLYGHICFWVGGEVVGDYATPTSLSNLIPILSYPIGDCGNRKSKRFCNMGAEEAFQLMYRAFFDDDFTNPEYVEEEQWARFDISLVTEEFKNWKLYLFDCDAHSRLLVGARLDSGLFGFSKELILELGEYDSIIRELGSNLTELWEREGGVFR
jgi:hypothetical protein